jgi:hypothetical protein
MLDMLLEKIPPKMLKNMPAYGSEGLDANNTVAVSWRLFYLSRLGETPSRSYYCTIMPVGITVHIDI